jgi:hypothetical protein
MKKINLQLLTFIKVQFDIDISIEDLQWIYDTQLNDFEHQIFDCIFIKQIDRKEAIKKMHLNCLTKTLNAQLEKICWKLKNAKFNKLFSNFIFNDIILTEED